MKRPRLFVSAEADLPHLLPELRSVELLSFGSPSRPAVRPDQVAGPRFHAFAFNDIDAPRPDLIAPARADAERIVSIVRLSSAEAIVFQCWFGVSRSTAALLIGAIASGVGPADRLAGVLRKTAPWATPNPLLAAHGDELLEQSGALSAAVERIGRGEETSTGRAFEFVA